VDEGFVDRGGKSLSTVLVTGITGFVGRALSLRLRSAGLQVRGVVRRTYASVHRAVGSDIALVTIPSINAETDWTAALAGVDAVVHLAARTHVTRERDQDPLQAYRSINVEGTEQLARSAAAAGVKRFIYLSSVKVNGEGREEPYTELDAPAPEDAYGISKGEAEQVLRRIGTETDMEVVILRPPLVYGPGVKANFLRLMQIVDRRIPLPFSRIQNKRSMIYLENLVDAIVTCSMRPEAAGKTYLVSDGEDVSTPELIRWIAASLERRAYLFPVPEGVMRFAGNLIGRTDAMDRLLGSLTVNTAKIRNELNWSPPYTMDQGLKETAKWFKKQF